MADTDPPDAQGDPRIVRPPPREKSPVETPAVRRFYDFGTTQEEVFLRKPLTEADIAALIVDEDELKTLGPCGGSAVPRRRWPGR